MRKVSRRDCVILPLVLKKRWYDMIDSGEKKEEYREYKDFWIKRIEKWQDSRISELIPHLEQKIDVIAFSASTPSIYPPSVAARDAIDDFTATVM
jgi:hypothetical protein